ncbi:hypothetical protein CWATWH0003_1187b4, partial [Crocosphaera watsonii WH 0003]
FKIESYLFNIKSQIKSRFFY